MNYILLDLDGTLLNTRDGIVTSVQGALETIGIKIDDLCLLERHIGPPLKAGFIEYYGVDDQTADAMVSSYRGFYKKLGLAGTKPYEGMEETLGRLKEAGFQLIVATSKPEIVAKEFLEHFAFTKYFIDICGSTFDGSRESKADVIRYVMKKNQIGQEDSVVMVGDRMHDVVGANQEGIPCIGVLYGFGSEEELVSAGAIHVVKSPKELADYLLSMR